LLGSLDGVDEGPDPQPVKNPRTPQSDELAELPAELSDGATCLLLVVVGGSVGAAEGVW
jgi:hypothetical protein